MTERILILRHASGLVNRARRLAITKWPTAKLEVHDLAAYGKPPADFRWDRYAHLLIDDEYLRKEGLLWLSELRTKPNFPKIVRVLPEPVRHKPPAEIDVKAPPMPRARSRKPACRGRHQADAEAREQVIDEARAARRQPERDRASRGEAPRRRRSRCSSPPASRASRRSSRSAAAPPPMSACANASRQATGRAQGPQVRRQRRFRPAVAFRAGIFRGLEHRQPVCRQGVRAWLHRQPCLHRHGVFPRGRPARAHRAGPARGRGVVHHHRLDPLGARVGARGRHHSSRSQARQRDVPRRWHHRARGFRQRAPRCRPGGQDAGRRRDRHALLPLARAGARRHAPTNARISTASA